MISIRDELLNKLKQEVNASALIVRLLDEYYNSIDIEVIMNKEDEKKQKIKDLKKFIRWKKHEMKTCDWLDHTTDINRLTKEVEKLENEV